MKRPFRDHHLFALLESYEAQTLPIDVHVRNYFRAHRSLGSKDRTYIADAAYTLIRWKGLLTHQAKDKENWEAIWKVYQEEGIVQDPSLPRHIQVSFPKDLYTLLINTMGEEKAFAFCMTSNQQAPIAIRTNTLKIDPKDLLDRLSREGYAVQPCLTSNTGILFEKRVNFLAMPEFKEGLFEVQDEGSQLLAALVPTAPGKLFLDYCAGSGGKSLAIAPRMENKGQIYLHDIRLQPLQEAKKRMKRAGIMNAQCVNPQSTQLSSLKKKMDTVLVDVPCSGTGTLRRNPDWKWRFSLPLFHQLLGEQRKIFEQALSFVKPGGYIVYATCSVLKEENEEQINHFLRTYPLEETGETFSPTLLPNGMDAFYGVVLKKR